MASAALRLNPRLHHHRLLLSRIYSATPLPQPEHEPEPETQPAPASSSSSDKISRLKADIYRESNPDRIASLFRSAGHDRLFHGDRQIYSSAIRRLASSNRTDLIESLLSYALSVFPSPSEGFLVRIFTLYAQSGMMDHALRTFNQIKPVTDRSFSALLSAYLEKKQFDQLRKAFETLPPELGFSPGIASYNVFLNYLCTKGNLVAARELLDEMPKQGVQPDVISYNTVLKGYLKKGDEQRFDEFLKLMYQKKLRPSVFTYNFRIQLLCNKRRTMEAQELLEAMISGKKFYPNVVSFNIIIDGFFKEGEASSALELYKKMKDVKTEHGTGITPNLLTYRLLMKGLVEKEMFLPATEIYQEVAKKKWTLPYKVVKRLVDGLLKISQKEEAEKVVKNMRKVVRGVEWRNGRKLEARFSS